MRHQHHGSAPAARRRFFFHWSVAAAVAFVSAAAAAPDTERRFRIAVACVSSDAGARLEGFGFTCADVRSSFELAARNQPIELAFYDNRGERAAALSNVDEAIRTKADLFIEYDPDPGVNVEAGNRLKAAAIPAMAINYPIPGAPLYGADSAAAGQIAGEALAKFAAANWRGVVPVAAIVGGTSPVELVDARAKGIAVGLRRTKSKIAITRIEANDAERMEKNFGAFLATQKGKKVLVAALDDRSAISAKEVIEAAGRLDDCVIVSQGLDRSIHGGMHEKKEISFDNRGSIVLGSVAYFVDRYGYDVLPLALRIVRGETVPAHTKTKHMLITPMNVFREYPPFDMN
ncbi:MAG: substrate-binding domain-containing protein [Betaproteobacteria bacterium]